MTKSLNFLLWKPESAPDFSPGGATFTDGTTIELASVAEAYVQEHKLDLSGISFIIVLESEANELASHTFQMEKIGAGTNLWLLANPKETNPNGSFTGKFLKALCDFANLCYSLRWLGVQLNNEEVYQFTKKIICQNSNLDTLSLTVEVKGDMHRLDSH